MSEKKEDGLTKIEFDRIEINTDGVTNPRQSPRDGTLRASIVAEGLKNPLRVWHRKLGGGREVVVAGKKRNDRYILVSGFGRYDAIKEERQTDKHFYDEVPCVTLHGTLSEILLGQLVEQVQHEDWNEMDVADSVIALTQPGEVKPNVVGEPGAGKAEPAAYSVGAVAEHSGVTESWLGQIVKVRQKCSPAVVAAIRSGRVPVSEVIRQKWFSLDPAKQDALLKQYLATKKEKGARAANRESRETTETPDRPLLPTKKEIAEVRSAMGILSSEPQWKGGMDALDWTLGRNKKFRASVAKAVDAVRAKGGRDEGKGKSL